MSKITVMFDSGQTQQVFVQSESDGFITSKMISFEDFKYILNDCQLKRQTYRIGRLPETYFDGVRVDSNELSGIFLFYVPAALQKMTYVSENDSSMIPFPNLLFCFYCSNGIVTLSRVFATPEKKDRLNDNSDLYYYPFGNVGEEGRICFGSNKIPVMDSISSFEYLIAVFLSSPTNNDLFQPRFTSSGLPLSEVIRLVASTDKFNTSLLVKNRMKVKDLLI